MKLTSSELRELYQQQTARGGGRQLECLAEDLLVEAATGSLTETERERVADHLGACADCAQEYRQLKALKPWAVQAAKRADSAATHKVPASGHAVGDEGWGRRLWGQFAFKPGWHLVPVCAALVIVAGVSITVWRSMNRVDVPHGRNERGESVKTVEVEPADASTLSDVPERLRWSGMEPAESYRVILYDFESTPLWESGPVKTDSIELPVSVRERLPRGQKIYWRVLSRSGVERRQSDLFVFTVAAPGAK